MEFSKYHGLGNDFVIVDARSSSLPLADADWIKRICRRNFGVGADGVLAVLPPSSPTASAAMRVLNADGSEAEMCGNGLRCVVKYLHDKQLVPKADSYRIETGAGPLDCVLYESDAGTFVTVQMGSARFTQVKGSSFYSRSFEVGGFSSQLWEVSMGNPHAVFFVEESKDALTALARDVGPKVENHPMFPNGTNVEFAVMHAPNHIELVVWERACGITMACGTGACATAAAAVRAQKASPDTQIHVDLPGGALSISVSPDYSTITMTGPAQHVFDAELPNQ